MLAISLLKEVAISIKTAKLNFSKTHCNSKGYVVADRISKRSDDCGDPQLVLKALFAIDLTGNNACFLQLILKCFELVNFMVHF